MSQKNIKTQTINIDDIHPAKYNPRIMSEEEQEKLKKGLNKFGLVDPIIIDLTDNYTVIGGHQRLEVLREINPEQELTLIPLGDIGLILRETDLKIKDKNDQKALNLALNKIQGDWDYSKLDDLLIELSDNQYQIDLTGFDDEDLTLNNDFDITSLLEDDDTETTEDENGMEILPDDYKNVQGEQPNHRVVIHLSFPSNNEANKFLKLMRVTKEVNSKSLNLFFGKDFNYM